MTRPVLIALSLALAATPALADTAPAAPVTVRQQGSARLENVPQIPADVREAVQRYQNYRAPFRYQQFRVGQALRSNYYAPAYRLNYDSRWGVPRAGAGLTYVRHYTALLLVTVRTGKVVKVYRDEFRWR